MKAVLHLMAPGIPVVDLFADASASPKHRPTCCGLCGVVSGENCVVDPGVGGTRPPIIVEADGRWYVGPGNGLFEMVQRRAVDTRSWTIDWRPVRPSA
jgi:hypothetical protein